jgi:hypothetical protein
MKELRATGEGIAREKESARATHERISREDERFSDKNSWIHYFGKCQVKNTKHLKMNLFFLWQNVQGLGKLQQIANSNCITVGDALSNRTSGILILHTSPPESFYDCINLSNKSIRK